MKELNVDHARRLFERISQLMEENKEYLTELDSALGDGDLGLTMSKGFAAANAAAKEYRENDIGGMLIKTGFTIATAVPSTMGTLMASAFMEAGKVTGKKERMGIPELKDCFQSMADAAAMRGKASEGEKTILDVLYPVARAVGSYQGEDIGECMEKAYQTAKESLEHTKDMINQHGKAAVFREKTLGKLDPGAAAACIMIQAFRDISDVR